MELMHNMKRDKDSGCPVKTNVGKGWVGGRRENKVTKEEKEGKKRPREILIFETTRDQDMNTLGRRG